MKESELPPKTWPEHVAQVCLNGHLVLSSLQQFPQFRKSFCEDCGAAAIHQCRRCLWPIEGFGPHAWMRGNPRPFTPPRHCGECGQAFPWTASALKAARDFTDEIDELSAEEKSQLKDIFEDLTVDAPQTPLAVSRYKKFIARIQPTAAATLQTIINAVTTQIVKSQIGP